MSLHWTKLTYVTFHVNRLISPLNCLLTSYLVLLTHLYSFISRLFYEPAQLVWNCSNWKISRSRVSASYENILTLIGRTLTLIRIYKFKLALLQNHYINTPTKKIYLTKIILATFVFKIEYLLMNIYTLTFTLKSGGQRRLLIAITIWMHLLHACTFHQVWKFKYYGGEPIVLWKDLNIINNN